MSKIGFRVQYRKSLVQLRESFAYIFLWRMLPFGAWASLLSAALVFFTYEVRSWLWPLFLVLLAGYLFAARYFVLARVKQTWQLDCVALSCFLFADFCEVCAALMSDADPTISFTLKALLATLAFVRASAYFAYIGLGLAMHIGSSYWVSSELTRDDFTLMFLVPGFAFALRLATSALQSRVTKSKFSLRRKISELRKERDLRRRTERKLARAGRKSFRGSLTLDAMQSPSFIADVTLAYQQARRRRKKGETKADIQAQILHHDSFSSLMDSVVMLDCNERMAQVLGADSIQDCLQRIKETLTNDSESVLRECLESMLDGRDYESEIKLRNLCSGATQTFYLQSNAFYHEERVFAVASMLDLTESVRLKEQLQQNEARKRLALETTQTGMCEIDIESRSWTADKAYTDQLGYAPGSLDGDFSRSRGLVHPEDAKETLRLVIRLLNGSAESFDRVQRLRHSSGAYRWFHSRMQVAESDEAGRPKTAVGTLRNVHDEVSFRHMVRIERGILTADEPLHVLLRRLAEGVEEIWSQSICYIYLLQPNQQEVKECFGSGKSDLFAMSQCGRNLDELGVAVHGSLRAIDARCVPGEMHSGAEEQEGYVWSIPIRVKGDKVGAFVVFNNVAWDSGEERILYRFVQNAQILLQRESQARKENEFELKLMTEDRLDGLGKLAGGIAHDFNNLLAVILTNAELVALATENEQRLHSSQQIVEAARVASGLCRKMLTYAGQTSFEISDVDISDVASSVLEMIRTGTQKRHCFLANFASSLPRVPVDRSMISQLILNLLTNAVEATPSEGQISVTTGKRFLDKLDLDELYFADDLSQGQFVYVRVADEGTGISEEHLGRIFDPFFTTKARGTGLGLATVIGAVRRHHGCVDVRSQLGLGTSITAYIPAERPVAIEGLRSTKRIAIVDDEDAVRLALERLLTVQGFSVISLASGEETIERMDELRSCDGIIIDQKMQGIDGFETYQAVRKHLKSLPVCFVSGYKLSEEVNSILQIDKRCSVMQKPFSKDVLQRTLDKMSGEASTIQH